MRYLGILVVVVFASLMTRGTHAQAIESGPLQTLDTLVTAIETSDINLLLEAFDNEATVFMPIVAAPARLSGKVEIRQAFESLFKGRPAGASPQTVTPREIATQSFGDVAIVTFHLGEVPRQPVQGPVQLGRRTLVLRHIGDRWLVVHLHASAVSNVQGPAARP